MFSLILTTIITSLPLRTKNILPNDPNKKIKLIIYYNKFKTSTLVIKNNSSPSIGVLQKKKKKNNVIYHFKCPLKDCISENNIYIYIYIYIYWFNLNYPIEETYSAPF